jgi:hypothetical protein
VNHAADEAGVEPAWFRQVLPAAATEHAVESSGRTNRQTLDTGRETRRVVRLYHQVQMITLSGNVENREATVSPPRLAS